MNGWISPVAFGKNLPATILQSFTQKTKSNSSATPCYYSRVFKTWMNQKAPGDEYGDRRGDIPLMMCARISGRRLKTGGGPARAATCSYYGAAGLKSKGQCKAFYIKCTPNPSSSLEHKTSLPKYPLGGEQLISA